MSNHEDAFNYPFTGIVGQESMKRALIMNAINPEIGGILIKGSSGIGKSTAVRGLANLLPTIKVVADCPFHCDPDQTNHQCSTCKIRLNQGEELPVKNIQCPMVDLPINATEDRVAGTLDITKALREGLQALNPGLLAEANRGILYIDEINLLDDHIVDILLDAAAFGFNILEREGLSVKHPAKFMLIGTMNPEEGELRPQIADRIGLQIEAEALTRIIDRTEVIKRREEFIQNPLEFRKSYKEKENELKFKIKNAIDVLPRVTIPDFLINSIAKLCLKAEAYSHRSDITILQCAKAMAAFEEREEVEAKDIFSSATMALGHRLPFDPFDEGPKLDQNDIGRFLDDIIEDEKKTLI